MYPRNGSELMYSKEKIEDMLEYQLIERSKITPVILTTPIYRWYNIPMNKVSFRIGEIFYEGGFI